MYTTQRTQRSLCQNAHDKGRVSKTPAGKDKHKKQPHPFESQLIRDVQRKKEVVVVMAVDRQERKKKEADERSIGWAFPCG